MFLARPFKLVLTSFVGFWLAVMVPAHRLVDSILDRHEAIAQAALSKGSHNSPTDAPAHHGHDESHCAVCMYASGLTTPTPLTIVIALPELIAVKADRAPPALVIAPLRTPIHGRAPPAC